MKCYIFNPKCSGYIENWKKLIPHIKSMGFDTIHLLPITEMGYSQSPYATTNHFNIDAVYDRNNSREQALKHFEGFVSELAKNKIRLCVDLVLNHVSIDHPMIDQYKKWVISDDEEPDGIKRAGWQGEVWHKWKDLALLDFDSNSGQLLWEYMCQYVLFWSDFASRTDGFMRMDNFHSSNQEFLSYVLNNVRLKYPNVKLYTELFTDYNSLKELSKKHNISYLLGTPWEHKSIQGLIDFSKFIHSNDFPSAHFTPVNSQDSGSITDEFGNVHALKPRFAFSALMTTGNWGMYQGTELAIEDKLPFIGEPNHQLFIEKFSNDNNQNGLVQLTKTLNDIINKMRLFQEKGNIKFFNTNVEGVVSAIRFSNNGSVEKSYIYTFINFDTESEKIITLNAELLSNELDFNLLSAYMDVVSNERVEVKDDKWEVIIPASGFKLFSPF